MPDHTNGQPHALTQVNPREQEVSPIPYLMAGNHVGDRLGAPRFKGRYQTESKEHGDLAPYYQKTPEPTASKHPNGQRSFAHCDSLSKSLHEAAENARQLAADHREMSKEAK